ncbi:MAG: hypothetical protein EXR54_10245 [Dehalococcoidia bacterium]|nr:hypothetical protein [Dehalococcoidia bacterium]MSQ17909.1 hypothetical protein [Dehalococcoidia bacterium]
MMRPNIQSQRSIGVRVGRVTFLHCDPFYFDMEHRGLTVQEMAVGDLAAGLEAGAIDAAPLSLVECFRMESSLQPVAGFCVATVDQGGLALLYGNKPIQELEGARIGVAAPCPTSQKLLQVLLTQKYGVKPGPFVGLREPFDACLLVGNDALRRRRSVRGYPHRYDLGGEWRRWTNLPFVYARWMARKQVEHQPMAVLQDTLYVGLEDGVDALYHMAEPRDDLLMLPKDVAEYVSGLRYFIGVSEQRGMDKFRQCAGQLDAG